MAFQRVPNTWQFELSGTFSGGKFWEVNLYLHLDTYDQPTTGVASSFMQIIHDAYVDTNFDDVLQEDWNFVLLTVTGLDAVSDTQIQVNAHPVDGNDGSNGLPPQSCALGHWRTELRGRSFQGSIYHPGLTEGHNNNGTLDNTFLTNYDAWGEAIINGFTDVDRQLVVVSRFSGTELQAGSHGQVLLRPIKREEAITTEITNFVTKSSVATQRRRAIHP